MSAITGYASAAESTAASYANSGINRKETSEKTENSEKTGKVTGKTIGNAKLSEKAAKYYEQLKAKYSNMEFILVSEDQKATAQAQAASYANASKTVVLIDEDKIERMAEDEEYRAQYESIISSAASGLSQLQSSLQASGASVKGYGIQVNDNGTASYFAVLEKSAAAQKERIEEKREEAKEEKKAEAKKAEQEAQEERLNAKSYGDAAGTETVTIQASSIEELLQKISDYAQNELMDSVQTAEEQMVGQNFDVKW